MIGAWNALYAGLLLDRLDEELLTGLKAAWVQVIGPTPREHLAEEDGPEYPGRPR